ncbi:hypothetical protein D3C85_1267530 [compost metagenome]
MDGFHGHAVGQRLRRQGVDHRLEQVILGLLRYRQIGKRHQAGVTLVRRVFARAIHPAFGDFLPAPALMAGFRAGVRLIQVQGHAHVGTVLLPLRGISPRHLAVVAERLAVGAIHFMGHTGNVQALHSVGLPRPAGHGSATHSGQ